MKRGISLLITVCIVSASLFFTSCKKENKGSKDVQAVTVNNLQADTIVGMAASGQPVGAGFYTFYSLENNAIIDNSDSATNKWDLGFRGTTIITNSGNSGPASGGAFVYVGTFADLGEIPADSTFRTDNGPSAFAIPTGSGNGWYSYDFATNLVTPIPGRILVIRTASGKYAKVEILNYYKGGVTPDASASDEDKLSKQRYYTFKFAYQPDGSKKF
jgi:HmuY protein